LNVLDLDQAVARLAADISDHEVDEEQQRRKKRPDTTGREAIRNQPEFNEQLWQYLNRRVSDWRVIAGKAKAKEYAPLFSRIEKDFGVEGSDMLGVWGVESAFGDPVVQQHHMRPVIPSLATLAWAEPRRRDYWEMELINALTIIQRGWSTPEEWLARGPVRWATPRGCPRCGCISASTMTNDGKISPFGAPDDARASTARYFVERGKYRRGEQLNRSGIRFH
jgi:membrane-bound lytic murein transglycosylase B